MNLRHGTKKGSEYFVERNGKFPRSPDLVLAHSCMELGEDISNLVDDSPNENEQSDAEIFQGVLKDSEV